VLEKRSPSGGGPSFFLLILHSILYLGCDVGVDVPKTRLVEVGSVGHLRVSTTRRMTTDTLAARGMAGRRLARGITTEPSRRHSVKRRQL
jgi:hypothetical protein